LLMVFIFSVFQPTY